jgi:TRAP-type C4-dicarboxylate transport system permease small subunit
MSDRLSISGESQAHEPSPADVVGDAQPRPVSEFRGLERVLASLQLAFDYVEKAAYGVAMLLMAALFLNTANGILVKQFTGSSLVWVEEINNLLFAWTVFIGAGVIARIGGHIGVDIVYIMLGAKLQRLMRILYALLALIVVFVMVFYGIKMANFVGRSQTSLYLSINLYWYYLSIPVGGALLGLFTVSAALPDPRRVSPVHEPTEVTP